MFCYSTSLFFSLSQVFKLLDGRVKSWFNTCVRVITCNLTYNCLNFDVFKISKASADTPFQLFLNKLINAVTVKLSVVMPLKINFLWSKISIQPFTFPLSSKNYLLFQLMRRLYPAYWCCSNRKGRSKVTLVLDHSVIG